MSSKVKDFTVKVQGLAVSEEDEGRGGAVAVLLGHQVVVALDQQRTVLVHFLVNELQPSQYPFVLILAQSV